MTENELKIRRAGYQAGYMAAKRKHFSEGVHALAKVRDELVMALGSAIEDGKLDESHPARDTLKKHTAPPKQERARKMCKGSVVTWQHEDGSTAGGILVAFKRYEHGAGQVWDVQTPTGTVERLITHEMITRYGPMRRPRRT